MIKQRIIQILESQGIRKEEFYKKINMTSASFRGNAKKTPLNSNAIENILTIFPSVNATWLLTGKGEMFNDQKSGKTVEQSYAIYDNKTYQSIPLIPMDAMLTKGKKEIKITKKDIESTFVIPEWSDRKIDFLIRVSGTSMQPKFSNGDIVACRHITDTSFFQYGKVYLLNTNQGVLIKRLFASNKEGCVTCVSDNKEEYPPFEIHEQSIYSYAIIVGVIQSE